MGSAIIVWKCDPITVELRQDQIEDAEDIPITWRENGVVRTGYADHMSMKIRNSTKTYPQNSFLHPSYLINGTWFCKGDDARINPCDAPEQIDVDVTGMKVALDNLHSSASTKYDGGINDKASRKEWRQVVNIQAMATDILMGLGKEIALNDEAAIRSTLNMQSIEDSLMSNVFKHMWNHPFGYKLMGVAAFIIFCFVCYFIRSCQNLLEVKSIRSEKPKPHEYYPGQFSKTNYFNAIFSHNKMELNKSLRKIDILKLEKADLMDEVKKVNERLDKLFSMQHCECCTKNEKANPPPYATDIICEK